MVVGGLNVSDSTALPLPRAAGVCVFQRVVLIPVDVESLQEFACEDEGNGVVEWLCDSVVVDDGHGNEVGPVVVVVAVDSCAEVEVFLEFVLVDSD